MTYIALFAIFALFFCVGRLIRTTPREREERSWWSDDPLKEGIFRSPQLGLFFCRKPVGGEMCYFSSLDGADWWPFNMPKPRPQGISVEDVKIHDECPHGLTTCTDHLQVGDSCECGQRLRL